MKQKSNTRQFREGNEWGCPQYSATAGMWLVQWFKRNGGYEGSNIAKGDDLQWILDNPAEVARMQDRVSKWRESLT